MNKVIDGAPHEVILVLDASTGQNAMQQAKAFTEAVDITGLALTKLDGTAKGGIVIGISNELSVPVKYIGLGEKIEDLQIFNKKILLTLYLGTKKYLFQINFDFHYLKDLLSFLLIISCRIWNLD